MLESTRHLLIDVGNTNTKIGFSRNREITESFVLPTYLQESPDTFGLKVVDLCRYLNIDPQSISAWMVSSVVPALNGLIKTAGQKYCGSSVFFVPEDIALPLKNEYANPHEVGSDRIVTAYAARKFFLSPALIVVDFGTATTVECVQDWSYLGGLICPGVLTSLKALSGQTAKLPSIGLVPSSPLLEIGSNTVTSLNQGFIFGFASMIEGLCSRLKSYLQGEVTVVATGGFAQSIQPVCAVMNEVRQDLLLQGLLMASELVQQ